MFSLDYTLRNETCSLSFFNQLDVIPSVWLPCLGTQAVAAILVEEVSKPCLEQPLEPSYLIM